MEIVKVKIDDLKPSEYNPRQIDNDELEKLRVSILRPIKKASWILKNFYRLVIFILTLNILAKIKKEMLSMPS